MTTAAPGEEPARSRPAVRALTLAALTLGLAVTVHGAPTPAPKRATATAHRAPRGASARPEARRAARGAHAARPAGALLDRRSAQVRMLEFANGPRVLLAPDSLAGAANVGVWFEAGSRNDPAGQGGLAQVLAQALAPAPAARRPLEELGATFAASVTPDMTVESVTVPAELLDEALDVVLAPLDPSPLSDSTVVAQVRRARMARAARLRGSPLLPAIERLEAALYAGHGYAVPSTGRDDELARIAPADARTDLAKRFDPHRALLTVVGRFDAAALEADLARRFGAAGAAPPAVAPTPATFAPPARRSNGGSSGVPVAIVLEGWRGLPDADPDAPALDVLAELLTGGERPLLHRELAGPGQPFLQVQGSYERRRDASALIVAGAVASVKDSGAVESALAKEVERWAREPVDAAQLEAARHSVEAAMLARAETAEGRAEGLASAQLLDGDWRAWAARVDAVRSVTAADVRRAAARALDPKHRAIVWARAGARGEDDR